VTFDEVLEQALELLRRRGRVSYRALKVQLHLDDDLLEILKEEIVAVHQLGRDQEGTMLVWTGDTAPAAVPVSPPTPDPRPGSTDLHAALSGRENFHVSRCPGR
jgi:hypothetical protein